MKEQLISYKTAKLAKEKKFDLNCHYAQFVEDEEPIYNESAHNWNLYEEGYSVPTQSSLQKWLREVHKLSVEVFSDETHWEVIVEKLPSYSAYDSEYSSDDKFNTYEEALEEGLKQALKLIK